VNYSSRLYEAKWFIPDLSKKIPANLLDPSLFEKGVYIPNLVRSPSVVNKAYAEPINRLPREDRTEVRFPPPYRSARVTQN
jgi:hypothetical protein